MAEPSVSIERQFDGNHAVYVGGVFRFAGDEEACRRWVDAVILHPRASDAQRDASLGRALGY